ncbi:MAG: DUF1080 domain-containing protein [Sedimentisphaerales bacterium]|nr:DUF1080 domain-containing protein [Sedimentisphaerales bacterium]
MTAKLAYASLVGLMLVLLAGCAGLNPAPSQPTALFNGRDLAGWDVVLQDNAANDDTFTVQDGVIHCTGDPVGFIRTAGDYKDFLLHVEWRWGESPGNSGILVHAQAADNVWPLCVEAQLMANNAGDIILIGGSSAADYPADESGRSVRIPKRQASSETPPGQWNQADVYCAGDTVRVYVNGVLQNTAFQVNPAAGRICLQSEGAPIEFRNITLTPLP